MQAKGGSFTGNEKDYFRFKVGDNKVGQPLIVEGEASQKFMSQGFEHICI